MKKYFNNKYVKWGLTGFSVIASGLLFCYFVFYADELFQNLKVLSKIAMPVTMGLVIAYLLTPSVNFLEQKILFPICRKFKIKEKKMPKKLIRGISIALTMVLVFFVFYALIAMLISQIVPSIQSIVNNFDGYVRNVTKWMNELPVENEELYGYLMTLFAKMTVELENWLKDTANVLGRSGEIIKSLSISLLGFLSTTWNMIIGFIISIYVLANKEVFVSQAKKIIYALFDTTHANCILDSMKYTHRVFGGYISGKILDSLLVGVVCFIGTSIMKTPYAALVSVIVGITNIIPFFGPYLGAIPSAILILIVDLTNPLNAVYFLLFILVLQQVDGNFIEPMIVGDSTGLSGFWVIFSIIIFGGIFGIPGMILGVPVFALAYSAIKGLVNSALRKKNMPTQTALYLDVSYLDEDGFHETEQEVKKSRKKRTTISKKDNSKAPVDPVEKDKEEKENK